MDFLPNSLRPTMQLPPLGLIVWEPDGYWTGQMRARLQGRPARVVQAGHLEDCWSWHRRAPWAVVGLAPGMARIEAAVDVLQSLWQQPEVPLTVVFTRGLPPGSEMLWLEAGASGLVASHLDLETWARLACRQAAQAPKPNWSPNADWPAQLPWSSSHLPPKH